MALFYRVAIAIVRAFLRISFGVKFTGKEQLDMSGRIILVSNHKSNLDPLLLASFFKKMQVHFFAKAELFKSKIFAYLLGEKGLGAIPVHRGDSDIAAMKKSLEILKSDKCIGIFPEGTRMKDGIGEFQRGFASMALKTDAMILPAYIDGDYKVFKKMHLIIGDPIAVGEKWDKKNKEASAQIAEYTKERIIELRDKYAIYGK